MENDVHTPPFRVCAYTYYEIEKDYLVITHSKHKTCEITLSLQSVPRFTSPGSKANTYTTNNKEEKCSLGLISPSDILSPYAFAKLLVRGLSAAAAPRWERAEKGGRR